MGTGIVINRRNANGFTRYMPMGLQDICQWVYISSCVRNAEVKVRAGGKAGAPHISNELPLRHALSCGDNVIGHVHIDGREAV